jgi:6,7-dimethyl-8-ribityllumazine synthase
MSGAGAPKIQIDASGLAVTVVVTSWHTEITDGLLAGAERALKAAGNDVYSIMRVPGAFELPLAAQIAIEEGAEVVIALGVVIRGGTPHFEYVCSSATDGLTRVQLDYGVPIGFGLLTVDNEKQALDRAGLPGSKEDKGAEAVEAAITMARLKAWNS